MIYGHVVNNPTRTVIWSTCVLQAVAPGMTSEVEIECQWYPLPEVEGGEGDWGREVTAAIVSGTPSSTNSEGIVIPVIHVYPLSALSWSLIQLDSCSAAGQSYIYMGLFHLIGVHPY